MCRTKLKLWRAVTLSSVLSIVATLAVVFAFTPSGEPQVLAGRPVELPGAKSSQVVALAIVPPQAPRISGFLSNVLAGQPVYDALKQNVHANDEGAAHSRYLAEYAARHIVGDDPQEWVVQRGDAELVKGETVEAFPCPASDGESWQLACVPKESDVSPPAFPSFIQSAATSSYELKIVGAGDWEPVMDDSAADVSPTLHDWVGGSAGLAYALAYLDRLEGGRLIPDGMVVAATGGLAAKPYQATAVLAVEGVKQKVEGAALAGADVVFVPKGQTPDRPAVPTIEVETVEQAVWWLCVNGATADVC